MNKPEDIHPSWPRQPPDVKDNIPVSDKPCGIKPRKTLCPRYFHQCFKTECKEKK